MTDPFSAERIDPYIDDDKLADIRQRIEELERLAAEAAEERRFGEGKDEIPL